MTTPSFTPLWRTAEPWEDVDRILLALSDLRQHRSDTGDIARYIGVAHSTVYGWTTGHGTPNVHKIIDWAWYHGLRLTTVPADGALMDCLLPPPPMTPQETWHAYEYRRIAHRLRHWRKNHLGFSQPYAARLMDRAPGTLNRWELVRRVPPPVELATWTRGVGQRLTLVSVATPLKYRHNAPCVYATDTPTPLAA